MHSLSALLRASLALCALALLPACNIAPDFDSLEDEDEDYDEDEDEDEDDCIYLEFFDVVKTQDGELGQSRMVGACEEDECDAEAPLAAGTYAVAEFKLNSELARRIGKGSGLTIVSEQSDIIEVSEVSIGRGMIFEDEADPCSSSTPTTVITARLGMLTQGKVRLHLMNGTETLDSYELVVAEVASMVVFAEGPGRPRGELGESALVLSNEPGAEPGTLTVGVYDAEGHGLVANADSIDFEVDQPDLVYLAGFGTGTSHSRGGYLVAVQGLRPGRAILTVTVGAISRTINLEVRGRAPADE